MHKNSIDMPRKPLTREEIAKRLVLSYVNEIVTDDDGNLDYEETVYRFAIKVVDEMPMEKQYAMFRDKFTSYDDCFDCLMRYTSLREELELFLIENQNKF